MNDHLPPLLELRNLVVHYPPRGREPGLTAVNGVSLSIASGRIVALVGESGSGKTTLARAILRLLPAAGGEIRLDGEDLATMNPGREREARRRVQAVFQDPLASLSPRRNVLQTLREPLDHFRIGHRGSRDARARQAMEQVELDAALQHRYPHQLSGGQRQRVALARALVTRPRLIIADEPLSSLDVTLQARIGELLLRLRDGLGTAFLLVTHDLAVARRLADEVAVMYRGALVESGPADAVLAQPAHPYTRALLAAVPIPDPAAQRPRAAAGEPAGCLTPTQGCVFHSRCPDRFEPCGTSSPGVSCPSPSDPDHRVRCHIWTSGA